MNIEDDFIDRTNMEFIDPADDAAKYDIEKAVLEIPEDDETIMQLCILLSIFSSLICSFCCVWKAINCVQHSLKP